MSAASKQYTPLTSSYSSCSHVAVNLTRIDKKYQMQHNDSTCDSCSELTIVANLSFWMRVMYKTSAWEIAYILSNEIKLLTQLICWKE